MSEFDSMQSWPAESTRIRTSKEAGSYDVDLMDWSTGEAAVLDLLRATMPGDASRWANPAVWRWKHLENPFGKSVVLVAADRSTGTLIGLRAFMAWRCLVGGEPTLAYRAVDTATHQACRKRGIFSNLTKLALDRAENDGARLIFNTPNRMSVNGYVGMGWTLVTRARTSAKICSYPRLAIKLASNVLLRSRGSEDGVSTEAGADDRSVAAFLADGAAVRSLLAADAAWKHDKIVTDRSKSYLTWRFRDHPVYSYSAVTTGAGDGVCFVRQVSRGRLNGLLLQEMMLRRPARRLVAELVKTAQRSFRPDFMSAYAPEGSFQRCALGACGFRWMSKNDTNFVSKPLGAGLSLDPTRLANWSLSQCDLEFF